MSDNKFSFKKLVSAVALASGMFVVSNANAGMMIIDDSFDVVKTDASQFSCNKVSIYRELGTPKGVPVNVAGFGKGMPLSVVLKEVIPAGWDVNLKGLTGSEKVDWAGNRGWNATLEDMAKKAGMTITVDWRYQKVNIFNGIASSKSGICVRLKETEALESSNATKADVASKLKIQDREWDISPEMTLRENIEHWASATEWKVYWGSTVDYRIHYPGSLIGVFGGENGVVAKLIAAYKTAPTPLHVTFWHGNKVIEVSEGGYIPAKEGK